MSLFDLIYAGSNAAWGLAEQTVADAIQQKGKDQKVAFPSTAYSLPVIYSATGMKINTLGDLETALGVAKSLIVEEEDLGKALNAGLSTAVSAEIIESVKYALQEDPYEDEPGIGFVPDPVIRSLGVPLVTGDIPGIAVLLGESESPEELAAIVKDYQSKGLLTFLVGKTIDQAMEQDVKLGLEMRVIPIGYDVTSVIHVVSVAVRAALIFGALKPGDLAGLLEYTKQRVPAFVNTFGPLNEVVVSAGAGAIALGFPVIADIDVPEVPGALLTQKDRSLTVKTSLETREIKIKVKEIDIPVAFAAAFEGERIRKDAVYAEFGSKRSKAWELVVMKTPDEIEDHQITLTGPDIDETDPPVYLPLGIVVEVAGKNMEEDFEPVLERRLHYFINYIEGIMHIGQRNIAWIRISKDAFEKGFRLKHFGEVLYAMMHEEFGTVVDKCAVHIYTDLSKVEELEESLAFPRYRKRDERLASLTDESVDTFYTCLLCQSFAPAHVCVVTPERLGLCGAVSWLDAKATKELDPTGACQPVSKEGLEDETKGIWSEVNKAVDTASQGSVSRVSLYSILEDPMTSCGCFECICGIVPEANGVVIVNREFGATTPVGMTFGELASMTGGGVQTPGFMGHGRHFIASKKFMAAEGGIGRIIWMPKELKDDVRDRLNKTAKELYDIDNFTDMICDETIATDVEDVIQFLSEVGHPALDQDPIM
ncbi:CO dehydrogenase/CO-methylating acetyl-CoA synthase complex subunit beta [Alkalibacter rhizosphaerae]|uniref:CO-methylating acetyl-CoA synthase n=1 Tax=Alkalibacter rhizosphaerae TaxID=2815577 RepID=A0A974XEG1_9FIRM|nr:acetyl-CoA decarbonylase/synthase complex subunit alpha/beta [Alkalibacter rhizosphaerae]QSX08352.1 CO dehydrogenase/CO-methylating acetyl-CoA synthase complex subunit beta [Alkalibacter rhizosphaerae]